MVLSLGLPEGWARVPVCEETMWRWMGAPWGYSLADEAGEGAVATELAGPPICLALAQRAGEEEDGPALHPPLLLGCAELDLSCLHLQTAVVH